MSEEAARSGLPVPVDGAGNTTPDNPAPAKFSADSQPVVPHLRMMAVLVLYRMTLEHSRSWQSLAPQVSELAPGLGFQMLVCANEADEAEAPPVPAWVEYLPRKENAGLAWAYNAGLRRASQTGAEWLLTLDQDTALPSDFLAQMFARAAAMQGRTEIAAIVPELMSASGEVYSPFLSKTGYESALPGGFTGVAKGDVRAFNSGALLRVEWLGNHGGYNPLFWLNFLDHAVFRTLGKAGGRVWIAGDIQVEHHLSLAENRTSMSASRFRIYLEAEAASIDLYGTRVEGWLHTLRLAVRRFNQRRRGDPAHFVEQTGILLHRRLTMPRLKRVDGWMKNLKVEHPWIEADEAESKRRDG